MADITKADAVIAISEALEALCGKPDTFEARDMARNVVADGLLRWEQGAQREAAWAADRQLVADMERDGLL